MIYYGICRGGPLNLKRLAHGTDTLVCAIDRFSGKYAPGVIDSEIAREEYHFGRYRWDVLTESWWWESPETPSETQTCE